KIYFSRRATRLLGRKTFPGSKRSPKFWRTRCHATFTEEMRRDVSRSSLRSWKLFWWKGTPIGRHTRTPFLPSLRQRRLLAACFLLSPHRRKHNSLSQRTPNYEMIG